MAMYKTRSELACCGKGVLLATISRHSRLDSEQINGYSSMLRELLDPDPHYCPWTDCLSFVPKRFVKEDYAWCPLCKRRMCMGCRKQEHPGFCRQDKKLLALISLQKWKPCPSCGNVLERTAGCNQ
jgi:hypothetical protein